MLGISHSWRQKVADWLRQGMSPQRLALTLALGFAIGCIPVVGAPTVLCAGLAFALRLNLPAIQAANYAAMPLQVALILPFVRLGGWLVARSQHHPHALAVLPFPALPHMFLLAIQALVAWMLFAGPAVLLLTLVLIPVLRRIPILSANSAD